MNPISDPRIMASVTIAGQKILLPMIRKVMPTMMANSILGVQPMTGPGSSIFNHYYGKKEYNKKYWPYQYTINDDYLRDFIVRDAERWCWDRFKGRYWSNHGRNFVFKREKDAVMFALRWA